MTEKLPDGLEDLRIIWLGEDKGEDSFDVRVDVEFVHDYKKAREFVDMIAKEYYNSFNYKHDNIHTIRNVVVVP